MKKWFRKRLEVLLIRIAKWILLERNVARSAVVSRKDNNAMWSMAEKLDGICDRILDDYERVQPAA
jgi:hypothetical protein